MVSECRKLLCPMSMRRVKSSILEPVIPKNGFLVSRMNVKCDSWNSAIMRLSNIDSSILQFCNFAIFVDYVKDYMQRYAWKLCISVWVETFPISRLLCCGGLESTTVIFHQKDDVNMNLNLKLWTLKHGTCLAESLSLLMLSFWLHTTSCFITDYAFNLTVLSWQTDSKRRLPSKDCEVGSGDGSSI